MPASLRELRQRRNSVNTTKKITRAMELIASSRIVKAQQTANRAVPYSRELLRAVSAVATYGHTDHPLTRPVENSQASAVVLITSDRGMAGAYSSNVIRESESLIAKLRSEGQQVQQFIAGRKGIGYARFRNREIAQQWDGFSDSPTYANAKEISDAVIEAFMTPVEQGGVDEIHLVYTRFQSMLVQRPTATRLLPLEVVEDEAPPKPDEMLPLYSFEPDAETVLDQLLPLYVANRIHFALLQSAASELASRQRAMKSATDNAQQLIESLTRQANQARQAEITQEISEIVGGASALAESDEEE